MKAAVLHEMGGVPRYEDFPDPVAGDGEVVVEVKAVAVEQVDRLVAAGSHYASASILTELPAVPGFDGVGALPDGSLVGFALPRAPYGALAERTVVPAANVVPVADGLDPVAAVVLPSAVPGMAIVTAAGFVPGETVLVQGATGVAGRLAVQVARLLGAGRIVATGRDDGALAELRELGADEVLTTAVPDDELAAAYGAARGDGYDVVLDFLWGRPTEVLLRTLVPASFSFPKRTRVVQVGEAAGAEIALAAASLRTSGVELCGAAKGLDAATIAGAYERVVGWARAGRLRFGVDQVALAEVEAAWLRPGRRGRRLVVTP